MAICVMAEVGVAPCQCFSPGGNQTTSPGWISSIGLPSRWARPQPLVTIRVWPSGCVCQAVRAPGSKVTLAPLTLPGAFASNSGSIRTVPVNQSAGPLVEGREPTRLISMCCSALVTSRPDFMAAARKSGRARLTERWLSLPQHGRGVLHDGMIGSDDRQPLVNRLSDEQPVKRIAVMVRQA